MVGRPRKSMEPRKPCGRLQQAAEPESREPILPTPENQARREHLFGKPLERGELECPINQLGKRLSVDQRVAARRAKSLYGRFGAAVHMPRIVVGSLRDYVQGSGSMPDIDPEATQKAKEEYDQMRRAVLREVRHKYRYNTGDQVPASAVSGQAWKAVHGLVMGIMPGNLHALRIGLDALVTFWDIEDRRQITSINGAQLEAA